jgi:hypothetical protein
MDDFSFAYMQEAFVAALLVLARGDDPGTANGEWIGDDDWEQYEFYRVIKKTVETLREDMGGSSNLAHQPPCAVTDGPENVHNTPASDQNDLHPQEMGRLSLMSFGDGMFGKMAIADE